MNDLQIIKQKVYEDNKIEYILEQLGCSHIKHEQRGELIVAMLPDRFDSPNHRSVQVKNTTTLASNIRNKDISGDIFNIIQYINDCDLPQSKYWICNVLGYNIDFKKYKPKKNWNSILHSIQRKRQRAIECEDNIILPETTLLQFADISSYEWWAKGMKYNTQREFEIMLDGSGGADKIVFAVRDEEGRLLSVKARFTKEYEEQFKNKKYFYIYPYNGQLNLYNLHRAKEYINDEVYVFESEKACMMAWQWGIKNCISTQGNQITPVQIHKLLRLNCKINFVFDKDIPLEFYNKYKNQLQSRLVYAIIDTDDMLSGKDSPVDKGEEIFLKLITQLKYKYKI